MGGCEPGQARDRAAISGYFHVPGVLVESRFFMGCFSNCFILLPGRIPKLLI